MTIERDIKNMKEILSSDFDSENLEEKAYINKLISRKYTLSSKKFPK